MPEVRQVPQPRFHHAGPAGVVGGVVVIRAATTTIMAAAAVAAAHAPYGFRCLRVDEGDEVDAESRELFHVAQVPKKEEKNVYKSGT